MKIHKIEIKNFKGFAEEIFHFNPHFTVIIGENATGKTSILDALAIVAGAYLLGIGEAPKYHIQKDEQVRRIDLGDRFAPQFPVEIWADGEIYGQKLEKWGRILRSPESRTTKEADSIVSIAKEHEKITNSPQNTRTNLPVLAYYSTKRREDKKPRIENRGKGSILQDGYYACLELKSNSKAYLEWFQRKEIASKIAPKSKTKKDLDLVKEAISNCIENWEDVYYDFDEGDLVGTKYTNNGTTERMPFHYLSDGQKMVVGLVTDLAYRCVMLNGHLTEKAIQESQGIVLIDEIDLHLHPRWQKRIVADLKRVFPNIQFIATTHSPFIVQSLSTNEKINLGNIEDGLDSDPFKHGIEDIAEYEMGVEMPQRSQKFLEMERVASEYFALVAQGKTSQTDKKVAQLRQRLNELENYYSDDPAFVAFLKAERKSQTL
jgi:predicted ATP-binding protein involved in virulence